MRRLDRDAWQHLSPRTPAIANIDERVGSLAEGLMGVGAFDAGGRVADSVTSMVLFHLFLHHFKLFATW